MIDITIDKTAQKIITAQQISRNLQSSLQRLIFDYNQNIDIVWKNGALTPQEICDSLGNQASQLFIMGGLTSALILSISPESANLLKKPLKKFTVNQDGTMTIGTEDYDA